MPILWRGFGPDPHLRREETNADILAMAKEGATIKKIVRSAGYNRGLARKVLR